MQNLNEYNGIKLGDYVVGVQINYPLLLTKIDDFGNGYPIFECENNDRLRYYARYCSKWTPSKDEYCFFFDNENVTPLVATFLAQAENGKFLANIPDGKGTLTLGEFTYCIPFDKNRKTSQY